MADNWGLHAVVNGYSGATGNPMFFRLANNPTSYFNGYYSLPCFETEEKNNDSFVHCPDQQNQARSEYSQGLKDLFKPMFRPNFLPFPPSQTHVPISSPPSIPMQHFSPPPQPQQVQVVADQPALAPAPKPKKKRSEIKRRVCENVPAAGLTSDMWGWRKYGQKPIKGTPHPRSYYRCTSSNCSARKMVEKRSSGPDRYAVIYLHDHNHAQPIHLNSAAGKSRPKRAHPPAVTNGGPGNAPPAPPVASIPPAQGNQGNGLFGMNNSAADEFFNGLDELFGPVAGDGFSGIYPYSWMGGYGATTATSLAGM